MKRPGLRQRLKYWFDNRMSRGTVSMIKMLTIATAVFIVLVALFVTLFGLQEEGGFGTAAWDSFASTVNAWVFYSGDGSIGYVAVMALSAVAGLFVTSVLIGIISSGIEEKLNSLRRGNSLVLERGHVVVIGFNQNTCRIIGELCQACANKTKQHIVVMGSGEKEEMEQTLRDAVDVPRGVHVIFRSGNTADPAALRCCAIPDSRAVIVCEENDHDVVKSIMAVALVLRQSKAGPEIRIAACVTDERAVAPARIAGEGRADVLHVDEILSRLLAYTCRQTGVSEVVANLFSFTGDEIYFEEYPSLYGVTVSRAALCFKRSKLLGLHREGKSLLNPAAETVIRRGDSLILLAEDDSISQLLDAPAAPDVTAFAPPEGAGRARCSRILVFGFNDRFETMARVLAQSCVKGSRLDAAGVPDPARAQIQKLAAQLKERLEITVSDAGTTDRAALEGLVGDGAGHVIILSDMTRPGDEADADTLLLLLQLRDIKKRNGLDFYITTEMRCTENKLLASSDDISDFIISSDIAGPVVAQVAECPALLPVFEDLLSNGGCELYIRDAADFVATGRSLSVATLIAAAAARGCTFVGCRRRDADGHNELLINPAIDFSLTLNEGDSVIVLSGS